MKYFFGILSFCLITIYSSPAKSIDCYKDKRIRIELVSSKNLLQKGDTLLFAIKATMSKGWHIYWVNPGDAGEPTVLEVATNLDTTQKLLPLFPIPSYKNTEGIVTLEYRNVVYFPFQVFVPKEFNSDQLEFKIYAKWLVCREKCVPGKATLKVKLPFGKRIAKRYFDPTSLAWFQSFPKDTLEATIAYTEDFAFLRLSPKGFDTIRSIFFFPITEGLFDLETKPEFWLVNNELNVKVPLLQYVWGDKSKVEGLLEIESTKSWKKYFWLKIVN